MNIVVEVLDSVHPVLRDKVIPRRAHVDDAGADLVAAEPAVVPSGGHTVVGCGIRVAIPHGFVGLVHPRSGLAAKRHVTVANSPGTIDSGYEGEVRVILANHGREPFSVRPGDRIAQLVVQSVELPEFIPGRVLADDKPFVVDGRGEGGFGSTGM